jgi:predicted phosphodiesterase
VHYPGKIIAIPGNHDGEVFRNTDPKSLEAFLTNFCAADAAPPPMAGSILRETMTQPGVYWWLDAPFIDIIGLYSNAAENPGFISGPIPGAHQKKWLVAALKAIKKKRAGGEQKALLIATHHPPFSAAGHSGSATMLADIDDACAKAGVLPDIFLAGHSHNYQRFTRTVTLAGAAWQIPFIVAGMGGRNDQSVKPATGHADGDHTLVATRRGYGYLLIAAQRGLLTVRNIGLDAAGERLAADADRVTVDLTTHTIQP